MRRVLIVFAGDAWYVRRVRLIEHDLDKDEKVYRCDKPLGGPFKTPLEAIQSLPKSYQREVKA
jgi:hypothetical protein